MKLVQQLIIYIILLFMVSKCFCSRTSITPSKPAPLYLTEKQYKNLKSEGLKLTVTNTPVNASKLRILIQTSDWTWKDTGTVKTFRTPSNSHEYWLPYLDLEAGENGIFVSLWTEDGILCGTRPVLIIQNDDDEIALANKKTRNDVEQKWLKECSKHSCDIELQWNNDCVNDKPIPEIKIYNIGDSLDVIYTSMVSPKVPGSNIYMILEAFDNNTKLDCGNPAHNRDNNKPVHIQVAEKSTADENLPEIRYDDSKQIDYNCIKEKAYDTRSEPTLRTYMVMIKENTVKIIPDLHSITKNDNGSIIACFYFKFLRLKNLVTRYVENKTKLIYEESITTESDLHPFTTAEHKYEKGNTSYLYYYIGGAAVVIIIILLIILLIIKKCCYISRKLTPELKTSSIMNSKQVLYAELELYALPNGTIRPVLQQSPYAQIVHPKELMYANTNLPSPLQGSGGDHHGETPYAQIYSVTMPAQVDQQNGAHVSQLQSEDSPNVQVVKDAPKF